MTTENGRASFELALKHAWDWFALHAQQRMQGVNFLLLASAFLSAGYGTAVNAGNDPAAIAVGLLGVLSAGAFLVMEWRVRGLIKFAEAALERLESRLSEETGIAEVRLVEAAEKAGSSWLRYSKAIIGLQGMIGLVFASGALYAWIASID